MTVAELIEKLKDLDQNLRIVYSNDASYDGQTDVVGVSIRKVDWTATKNEAGMLVANLDS